MGAGKNRESAQERMMQFASPACKPALAYVSSRAGHRVLVEIPVFLPT
jgi:hypothetical protein